MPNTKCIFERFPFLAGLPSDVSSLKLQRWNLWRRQFRKPTCTTYVTHTSQSRAFFRPQLPSKRHRRRCRAPSGQSVRLSVGRSLTCKYASTNPGPFGSSWPKKGVIHSKRSLHLSNKLSIAPVRSDPGSEESVK